MPDSPVTDALIEFARRARNDRRANSAHGGDGRGVGAVPLQEDQSLRLDRLPEPVWNFAVSGYRVLPRWLAARDGEALDMPLQRAILDIAWRTEELLHWFAEADRVLEQALVAPLARADLGLRPSGRIGAVPVGSGHEHDESPI